MSGSRRRRRLGSLKVRKWSRVIVIEKKISFLRLSRM